MNRLYTYGYNAPGGSIEDLKSYVEAGCIIADIRYSPRSRNPEWQQGRLKSVLGQAYRHVSMLGNINYKNGEPIKIADLRRGMFYLRFLMCASPVVLLCACADPHLCHRETVAKAALKQGLVDRLDFSHLRPGDRIGEDGSVMMAEVPR